MASRAPQEGRDRSELEDVADLNQIVARAEASVARLVGDGIRLRFALSSTTTRVAGKWSDLELVVMGLCSAARAALPDGGHVSVETHSGADPDSAATPDGVAAGAPRVVVRMQAAVPPANLSGAARSGDWLHAVRANLERVRGRLEVQELDQDHVMLVVHLQPAADPTTSGRFLSVPPVGSGSELVLLVEDEPQVRAVTARILKAYGYTVLTAQNAEIAFDHAQAYGPAVRLIISDLVLPGASGVELVARVRACCPDARVLFMSGYGLDDYPALNGVEIHFLRKPFTADELATGVRSALAAP